MRPNNEESSSNGLVQILNMDEEYESSEDEDFVVSGEDDESDTSSDQSEGLSSSHSSTSPQQTPKETVKSMSVAQSAKATLKEKTSQLDRNSSNITSRKLPSVKPICCICLNEQTDETNELVSCDSCGFYTHEGCYGIWDTESKKSSDSSASTEPWFCDSCLHDSPTEPKIIDHTNDDDDNNNNKLKCFLRSCELCPNVECGLMKETENGKFVHTVCALYTPGVEYQNTDKLWPVVLDGIPCARWGEQPCSLCENVRLSRTGVCIKCDAGMCKTYFHASCALKAGYLPDPNKQGDHDPFIGYCKQHNEKSYISARKTNYLAMMSSYRVKNLGNRHMFEADPDKDRISCKFKRARENYGLAKSKLIIHSDITRKAPRMLTTCPAAMKRLLAKNPLNSENELVVDQQYHSVSSVTFTTDFVKHYFDREIKIPQYYKQIILLKQTQAGLTKQEAELTEKSEQVTKEAKALKDENKKLKECFLKYLNLISLIKPEFVTPQSVQSLLNPEENKSNVNKSLNESPNTSPTAKKRGRKPKNTNGTGKSAISTSPAFIKKPGKRGRKPKLASQNTSFNTSNVSTTSGEHGRSKKSIKYNDPIPNEIDLDAACTICKQKTNTHLLVGCDTCKAYYHITCLDPPLASVPKKTKLYGWECSKCVFSKDNSSDIDEEEEKEQKALRRERKARNFFDSIVETKKPKKRKSEVKSNQTTPTTAIKKKRGRKPKVQSENKLNESEDKTKEVESDDDAIYIEDEQELMNHKKARGARAEKLKTLSRNSLPLPPAKSKSSNSVIVGADSELSKQRLKRKSVDGYMNTQ